MSFQEGGIAPFRRGFLSTDYVYYDVRGKRQFYPFPILKEEVDLVFADAINKGERLFELDFDVVVTDIFDKGDSILILGAGCVLIGFSSPEAHCSFSSFPWPYLWVHAYVRDPEDKEKKTQDKTKEAAPVHRRCIR